MVRVVGVWFCLVYLDTKSESSPVQPSKRAAIMSAVSFARFQAVQSMQNSATPRPPEIVEPPAQAPPVTPPPQVVPPPPGENVPPTTFQIQRPPTHT